MNSGILKLSWANVRGALVTAFITAVITIFIYIIGVGDIFALNYKALANVGVLSALTAFVDLVRSALTTSKNNFVGAVGIK